MIKPLHTQVSHGKLHSLLQSKHWCIENLYPIRLKQKTFLFFKKIKTDNFSSWVCKVLFCTSNTGVSKLHYHARGSDRRFMQNKKIKTSIDKVEVPVKRKRRSQVCFYRGSVLMNKDHLFFSDQGNILMTSSYLTTYQK